MREDLGLESLFEQDNDVGQGSVPTNDESVKKNENED